MSSVETITLAGGCFWCLDGAFREIAGVLSVESGYANGHVPAPSYDDVCRGDSGHAEVVQVRFDPQQVSLGQLLQVFFVLHDPTTLNRQGHDVGTQYRSGIYWSDPAHEPVIRSVTTEVDRLLGARVVTEVVALHSYWPAEDWHQHYAQRHPEQRYCALVVAPKLEKFRQTFAGLLRR